MIALLVVVLVAVGSVVEGGISCSDDSTNLLVKIKAEIVKYIPDLNDKKVNDAVKGISDSLFAALKDFIQPQPFVR